MGATSMLSSLGYTGLRALGVLSLSRRLRRGGVILCYHNVLRESNSGVAGDPGLHLAAERFEAQLRWLARHYSVLPLREFVARIGAGRSLRGAAALTFDDGYAGMLAHGLPVLRELGLPATVFVVAGAATAREPFWWDHPAVTEVAEPERRRWLRSLRGDRDAILGAVGAANQREVLPAMRPAGWAALLASTVDGIEIGAHSTHHRALPSLSHAELHADLAECRRAITDHIGVAPDLFAYPYGLWDAGVRDAVRQAGFTAAVTLDRGATTPRTDPWSLPRINIAAGLSAPAFESWVAGIRP